MTDSMMAVRDDQLRQFFTASTQRFDQAARSLGEQTRDFQIAGRRVRVRFAGAELTHLARPLAHLECGPLGAADSTFDLEILAWSGSGPYQPPTPPWDFQQLHWFGEIANLGSHEFSVNFAADQGLLSILHHPTRRALYWLPKAESLPFWETAAPFRIVLHWWSQMFGGHVAHAAAVGRGGQGVLLVGRGGSGKSTTAIACVDAGMEYVGDDYVLLTRTPRPTAHSLYQSAKIHTPFLRQTLSHWEGWVAKEIGPEGKSLLFLNEHLPQQIRNQLTIHGVVQPRVTTSPQARMDRQPASQGLLAIAPSTMYQLPEARQATLSFFAKWTREVPAYLLHLGTDLTSAPRVLSQLLAEEAMHHAA
ncbi:MAG: hypothetical protein L0Z07_04765 [Planctomycetes bacterium]|nr:hypothetical protein [Planctomycetota bacterium]